MAWRIALACLVLAGVPRGAAANGRPPATVSITFQEGHDSDIVVGLTFGLAISHDSGKTWAWMCEDAVGYKGTYDPRFAFSPSGTVFATTFNGFKAMRDRCTFNRISTAAVFASTDALGPGPDHALYYASSQSADPDHQIAADFNIYKSTDDGMTFPAKAMPNTPINWWQSLMVAPSDAQRLYLSGYAYVPGPGGGTVTQALLFRSDNGGSIWTPLPIDTSKVTLPPNALIDIVGIAKDNPDLVFMRVKLDDTSPSDLYRSSDKGVTWTPILHKDALISAFVVRAAPSGNKHDLIAGTQVLGAEISHDDGDTWTPLVNPPHMNCLVESAAGELWACTQNYGVAASVPSDDAGIMKTTDLVTWTKVLRYQDLTEAVTCAAGTVQKDTCAAMWCAVCAQLGCTPAPSYGCPVPTEAPVTPPSKGGCCDSGSGSAGALALALSVGMVLLRPRRRRKA
ncbi:MAG TPA: sialidase family protein [Kofleriaceae bacterium]|jgi:hypothetical protein|nr:sialidase family protein [Kofleriaceae bacterium]